MSWLDPLIKSLFGLGLEAFNALNHPHTSGSISFDGLKDKVEVIRDVWGVPHIFGRSIEDVAFAQGFTHAQERLWQMDFTRRLVSGRLSEILGKPALSTDIVLRTMNFRKFAEKSATAIGGQERDILAAFCDGVNACIRHEPLPLEFKLLRYLPEPWTIADSLSWNYLMFWQLSSSWENELLRGQLITAVGPEKAAELELDSEDGWPLILDANLPFPFQAGHSLVGPTRKDGAGSNNWVISGQRSKSGSPLLANDMHLGMSSPAIFIQNHVSCDELDVIGVTFPGIPLVVQGHNGHVAWGFTAGCDDVQDLYEEHLRTRDSQLEYELRGEWFPVTSRQEKILIKGERAHTETVVETMHGPIINHALLKDFSPELPPLAMRWTAFETHASVKAFLLMNQAQDCQAFREALRDWVSPVLNVVYADTQGNIAFTQPGEIPIRGTGDGSIPLPGWTGDHEWVDRIPFDEQPHMFNPPRGYIVTANNRVAGPDYPYYLGRDYFDRDRALRISELVEENIPADLSTLQKMQFDQQSPSARALVRAAKSLHTEDPEVSAALALFTGWDSQLAVNSAPAALYEVLMRQILSILLDGKLSGLEERVRGRAPSGIWLYHSWEWLSARLDEPNSPWWKLDLYQGQDAVLLEALNRSLAFLGRELGAHMPSWRWGDLHKITFGHILGGKSPLDKIFNLGPYSIGGDGSTVWATYPDKAEFAKGVVAGPPFRFTIDMADPAHAQALFVPGQSGRAGSAHYADGIADWFSGKYHPLLFLREEIEQNAEARLTLTPG